MLHFEAFFLVASLVSIGIDNSKVGEDIRKLGVDNSTVFHKGKEQKSSRAGQQNNFLIIWPHFSTKYFPKMQQITITII